MSNGKQLSEECSIWVQSTSSGKNPTIVTSSLPKGLREKTEGFKVLYSNGCRVAVQKFPSSSRPKIPYQQSGEGAKQSIPRHNMDESMKTSTSNANINSSFDHYDEKNCGLKRKTEDENMNNYQTKMPRCI